MSYCALRSQGKAGRPQAVAAAPPRAFRFARLRPKHLGEFFPADQGQPHGAGGNGEPDRISGRAARNKVIDEYRRASSRKHNMRREESIWAGNELRELADASDTPDEVAQASEALDRLRSWCRRVAGTF